MAKTRKYRQELPRQVNCHSHRYAARLAGPAGPREPLSRSMIRSVLNPLAGENPNGS
jgi:hypothetical protein